MVNPPFRNRTPFDSPANYQINVQGRIDPSWSDRLEDMVICLIPGEKDKAMTTLVGVLSDQAALAGVLHTLYELHVAVISVTRLDNGST